MPVIDLFPEHRDHTVRDTLVQFTLDDTRPETIRQVASFRTRVDVVALFNRALTGLPEREGRA